MTNWFKAIFYMNNTWNYPCEPSNATPLIIRDSLVISFSICVDDGIGIVLNSVVFIWRENGCSI